MTQAEWRGRSDFAEFAEAIGVSTDLIFTARGQRDGRIWVLYSPHYPEEETFWSVWLARGQDGILRMDSVPKEMPGLWEKFEKALEEGLPDE